MSEVVKPKFKAGVWGIVWKSGEPSEMDNALWLLEMLDQTPQPESAKIFQGTENGSPVTYLVYKYRK